MHIHLQILVEFWKIFETSWMSKSLNFTRSPKIIDWEIARLTTAHFCALLAMCTQNEILFLESL